MDIDGRVRNSPYTIIPCIPFELWRLNQKVDRFNIRTLENPARKKGGSLIVCLDPYGSLPEWVSRVQVLDAQCREF